MFNSDDLLQHIRYEITFGRPNEACELFLQLDHHLRNGGKPPSDWSEGPDDHPKPVKRLRKLLLAESTKLDELTADPHRKWDKDAVFRASIREQAFAEAIEELTSNQPAPVRRGVVENVTDDIKVLRHHDSSTMMIAARDVLTLDEDEGCRLALHYLTDEDARKLGEELTR